MCVYEIRGEADRERMIYHEELAFIIMEAEKSCNLPSASWRPRKAGGIIQSESEGLRTREADGVSPSLRAEEDQSGF